MKPITKTPQATRIPIRRGEVIQLTLDGQTIEAFAGETVATVLLVSGYNVFQHNEKPQLPGSLYCGMGVCFNCRVTVDGVPDIRACVTPIAAGMIIETGEHHRG